MSESWLSRVLAVAAGFGVVSILFVVVLGVGFRWVPACPEDAALVGFGNYSGQLGRFDRYRCGPAVDDLLQPSATPPPAGLRAEDVNGDGQVNVLDVQAVVSAFLTD